MTYRDLSSTVKNFMFDSPFFGHVLMKMKKTITDKVPTAAVAIDPESFNVDLLINPEYWTKLTPEQRMGLVHHETLHVAFGHLQVASTYKDQKIANIAMDMEINQYIPKTNVSDEWIHHDKAPFDHLNLPSKKGSKFYYEVIEEESKKNPAFKQMLAGMSNGTDHGQWVNYEDLSSQQQKMFDSQQKHTLKEAYKDSDQKSRGSLPGGLQRDIEKLFEKKKEVFDWKSWFRKFLGTVLDIARKKTFKRESKRFAGLPGLRTKRKICLFVSVDTSGSMGQGEIADVFEQINYIWKAGAVIRVVTWDTQIHDDFIYDGKPPKKIHGGGGSCIDPVIKLYNQQKRDYTAAIHLTDGHISCNEKLLGLHLFVITSNGTKFDPGSKCRMFQIPKAPGENPE
jgi:predicted metal-dependent peptidase